MSNNKLGIWWSRLKHKHLLLMILGCLVPIGLVVGWRYLFSGSGDSWLWLVFLLCPIMHIWMMKGHGHDDCDKNKNSGFAHKKVQEEEIIVERDLM